MNHQPKTWPAKPASSRWTDEQWAAIVAEGSHLLVAAAAGSGKTAVLVERIISRVADAERPLQVDSLLVATFTKAAAAEMKARIRRALEEALERTPDSRHLERQLALLPRAAITTLHSFCLEVVERYAPLIGLDPGFRIANETEAELLRMDTLDELFEETYAAEGENGTLARLADRFGGERSDEPLHRLILELHAFAASHPWPAHWLTSAAAQFQVEDAADLLHSLWVRSLLDDARLQLSGAAQMLEAALRLCREPGGPAPYADTLEADLAAVRHVIAAFGTDDWSAWQHAMAACTFGRLKACRGDEYDAALQERVKAYRESAKKTVAKLSAQWLVRSPERYAREMRELAPDMAALAELAIRFGERYEAAKRAKGLLDFGDLEHYALRILRDPASTPERVIPSAAALDYRQRFVEIYLDEYQDTNEVQEAIVSLIAREHPGNVFMVGDVKQSIYRFRLAEPGLFMDKYRRYRIWQPDSPGAASPEGMRIDLARNFRSRREIIEGVNHVFRLIMREPVGEMNYDRQAELVYGNGYPETRDDAVHQGDPDCDPGWGVELVVLDMAASTKDGQAAGDANLPEYADDEADGLSGENAGEEEELEAAQGEARCVAREIRRLMGADGHPSFAVYDGKSGVYRPVQYRDIVILLRATNALAPIYLEELKAAGIPAYADLATGYFAATEVDVMLSLLSIIDNPRQDIPLAGVLRSPIVGLTAEQLATIRLCDRRGQFWDAVQAAAHHETLDPQLRQTVARFAAQLSRWRDLARSEPLGQLLWSIYRDTGYYDFVGGMPGGMQRQANLRALVDRARHFEQSSRFRGLFRFLRFLGRMRDTGADLGAARALGEGENVVRIVSIHKSKGLEFPVVIAAGLGRKFNRQDLSGMFLKHKSLGFGPRMVELDTRVTYPTLPQLAIRSRIAAEMLAEEMRVLYVALTRPKEKLILVGTVKDAAKQWARWLETADLSRESMPDYAVASASCYLDWLGPAALLAGGSWRGLPEAGNWSGPFTPRPDAPRWACSIIPLDEFAKRADPAMDDAQQVPDDIWQAVVDGASVQVPESAEGAAIRSVLSWHYPFEADTRLAAKTSITAWKARLGEGGQPGAGLPAYDAGEPASAAEEMHLRFAEEGGLVRSEATDAASVPMDADQETESGGTYRLRRPRFIAASKLTSAERGSAYHLVMQHLPLQRQMDEAEIMTLLDRMVERKLLTGEQRQAIDAEAILAFCRTPLYARMCAASQVWREIPFTYGLPADEVYPETAGGKSGELVIIQGVVDCLFEESDGLVLIDYKTDALKGEPAEAVAEKHRFQVGKYRDCIERIARRPVCEAYVYFFDGGHAVRM